VWEVLQAPGPVNPVGVVADIIPTPGDPNAPPVPLVGYVALSKARVLGLPTRDVAGVPAILYGNFPLEWSPQTLQSLRVMGALQRPVNAPQGNATNVGRPAVLFGQFLPAGATQVVNRGFPPVFDPVATNTPSSYTELLTFYATDADPLPDSVATPGPVVVLPVSKETGAVSGLLDLGVLFQPEESRPLSMRVVDLNEHNSELGDRVTWPQQVHTRRRRRFEFVLSAGNRNSLEALLNTQNARAFQYTDPAEGVARAYVVAAGSWEVEELGYNAPEGGRMERLSFDAIELVHLGS